MGELVDPPDFGSGHFQVRVLAGQRCLRSSAWIEHVTTDHGVRGSNPLGGAFARFESCSDSAVKPGFPERSFCRNPPS